MDILAVLITALAGNIPALAFLYWAETERRQRVAAQERHDRLLLAVAGYKTEPDTMDIVRIQPDRNAPPD